MTATPRHAYIICAEIAADAERSLLTVDLLRLPSRIGVVMEVVSVVLQSTKLISFDKNGVTLRYKDYRRDGPERQSIIMIATDEFIRRFLAHVLSRGFHRIRHYGLLASSSRKANFARARTLLEVAAPPDEPMPDKPIDPYPGVRAMIGHGLHYMHPAQALWREAVNLRSLFPEAVGLYFPGQPIDGAPRH